MLFTKILVAYDGSNLSKKALAKAIEIVQQETAQDAKAPELHVIHGVQDVSFAMGTTITIDPKISEGVLQEARDLVPSSIGASYIIQNGSPANSILDYAHDNGIDLIIMGSRGLGAIREFFLGSVSHNVVQNSKVPVLIVK